jgi:hypothetical protein
MDGFSSGEFFGGRRNGGLARTGDEFFCYLSIGIKTGDTLKQICCWLSPDLPRRA